MCRTGCCGELIAKKECAVCFAMAKVVQFLDWRGSVRLRWMTSAEFAQYKALNGGLGTPVFLPDENPEVPILGFRKVAKRVMQELFMPNSWKMRHFTGPLALQPIERKAPSTDVAAA